MLKIIFLFTCLRILSSTSAATPATTSELIVWHVGQGQWVSEINIHDCIHYDMGGEKSPLKKVLALCKDKKNYISLSHLDWDHISFVKPFMRSVQSACLLSPPIDPTHEKFRQQVLSHIKVCARNEIPKSYLSLYAGKSSKIANQTSAVVYSKNFAVVLPGDSPKNLESHWRTKAINAKVLILGHHGSRTSTAKKTLQQLVNLKMSIASARQIKYGHPHKEVVALLKAQHIPLIRTEEWGNVHLLK